MTSRWNHDFSRQFFWITCLLDHADYTSQLNIAFADNKLTFK